MTGWEIGEAPDGPALHCVSRQASAGALYLVALDDPTANVRALRITLGSASEVGRGEGFSNYARDRGLAALVLSDRGVSRRHCTLRRDEAGVWVDSNRSFSTRLNGERVRSGRCPPMRPGDVLQVGPVRLGLMAVDPIWRGPAGAPVRRLANAIARGLAFDALPILADALEEAGCTDLMLLGHLRRSGPHTLGCWVVDLLLTEG